MASQSTLRAGHEKLSSKKSSSNAGSTMCLMTCASKKLVCSNIKSSFYGYFCLLFFFVTFVDK